jgi:hypothetical protein
LSTTEELEQRKAALALAKAELSRRFQAKHLKGELPVLRGIVAVGEDPDEVEARLRREAGLSKNDMAFVILRVIVGPDDAFLREQARQKAESDAIRDARNAAEDEWTPPPRVTVPDQLNATPISVVIDDNERVPDTIASYFIIADGAVILSDQGGRPLAKGAYCHPLRLGEQADRIAKRLLVKFDLDRGRGSGEIAYLETRR